MILNRKRELVKSLETVLNYINGQKSLVADEPSRIHFADLFEYRKYTRI